MGELAALATSFCWSATSVLFTFAGRRVGSMIVNRTRLAFAVVLLGATHFLRFGSILPVDASAERWWWLGLSGVIGLVLGDAFLFQAFVLIGPRLSMLMMSLVPVISSLMAWTFLGERLSLLETSGVGLAVAGVAWVALERQVEASPPHTRNHRLGLLAGLGAALGQAGGLIAAKRGLQGDFSTLSAVLMRMVVALVVIWVIAALGGQAGETVRALKDRRALAQIFAASVTGPFLGVWLSLIAIDTVRVGIASTLMGLPPVILLPVDRMLFGRKVTSRAIFGTIAALGGVAILSLI
jgi:drug/metabolite transporter (DMT)-like permease